MMKEDFLWCHGTSPQAYLTHMTTGAAFAVTHGEQPGLHALPQFACQLAIYVDERPLLRVVMCERDVIGLVVVPQQALVRVDCLSVSREIVDASSFSNAELCLPLACVDGQKPARLVTLYPECDCEGMQGAFT